MPDSVDERTRSDIMRRVKSSGTKPEMQVRRALHAAGYRYRLHRRDLPGSPDLVLARYRLVVFVHGCFWHWHGCKRSRMPGANRDYWEAKLARNVARDQRVGTELDALGWEQLVIWECELEQGIIAVMARLRAMSGGDGNR